jgi:hypothetical protein
MKVRGDIAAVTKTQTSDIEWKEPVAAGHLIG